MRKKKRILLITASLVFLLLAFGECVIYLSLPDTQENITQKSTMTVSAHPTPTSTLILSDCNTTVDLPHVGDTQLRERTCAFLKKNTITGVPQSLPTIEIRTDISTSQTGEALLEYNKDQELLSRMMEQ
jgi:hypothetical protein